MSNFACRVGACHTCATLASPCVTNWYQQFFYRALASIFSVFVEAFVVVNKGRVVVNPEYLRTTQHVVIYIVIKHGTLKTQLKTAVHYIVPCFIYYNNAHAVHQITLKTRYARF